MVHLQTRGVKGLVKGRLSWVVWVWCMAHRLKLVVNDALKGTAFNVIDEFLLRLYYPYEKSPKKCKVLEEVFADWKECMSIDHAWVKSICSSRSRWILHKLNAISMFFRSLGQTPITLLYCPRIALWNPLIVCNIGTLHVLVRFNSIRFNGSTCSIHFRTCTCALNDCITDRGRGKWMSNNEVQWIINNKWIITV